MDMNTKPKPKSVLHIYLLAHPKSQRGQSLINALQMRFVEEPIGGGLRLPVSFTPRRDDGAPPMIGGLGGIDLDAAQHSVVVVFADERMLRTIPDGSGNKWKEFVESIRKAIVVGESPHHLLCIALDTEGFSINDAVHIIAARNNPKDPEEYLLERQISGASFHITARCIQLLEHGKVVALAAERMQAPVQIFLSHAKVNLSKDNDDPVRATQRACDSEEYPIEKWFDSRNIATGQAFEAAIRAGIRDCSIMLVFQSDHYGSRPWCKREVVEAKRLGAHIVVVDFLENGEPRRFPYIGNVPVIRWRSASNSDVEARRVIERAILEALRFKFNYASMKNLAEPDDIVLAAPPEAFNLSAYANKKGQFLYPDPPLGREELEILNALDSSRLFTTPLTRLASSINLPHAGWRVATSISESDDIESYGLSNRLFLTLSDELHLYLLLAGLKITYGGALKGGHSDGANFTLRLFEIVRSYSRLAEGVGAPPLTDAIHNIAPWPLHLTYGESEWPLFNGGVASFEKGERPSLPWPDESIFQKQEENWFPPSDTPERRYAWARGLTLMREKVTAETNARIVLGGKLSGFFGFLPGVIEEAWMSIQSEKPLFLIGAYGGAAKAFADLFLGVERGEFSDEWCREYVPDFDAVNGLYKSQCISPVSLEKISVSLKERISDLGLARVLNNGLDSEENIELMLSSSPERISGLILRGIRHVVRNKLAPAGA